MRKYLYLISQKVNTDYDSYDSAVVCAASPEEAARMHPLNGGPLDTEGIYNSWVTKPEDVKVTKLGKAEEDMEIGVICASFNAG